MRFELSAGASATLIASDGDHASVLSSVASPPGSTLRAHGVEDSRAYALKVKTCQRDLDGNFLITGRWVSLSRGQRVFLEAQVRTEGVPDREAPPE